MVTVHFTKKKTEKQIMVRCRRAARLYFLYCKLYKALKLKRLNISMLNEAQPSSIPYRHRHEPFVQNTKWTLNTKT